MARERSLATPTVDTALRFATHCTIDHSIGRSLSRLSPCRKEKMAESPEHQFLSSEFLRVIKELSGSRLFTYQESARKKFDFSCLIAENWRYALDGQTLWKHSEGIDKDIRTLIVSSRSQIAAYVARDTFRNRAALYEATEDFRSSGHGDTLQRLKIFWIPADFDADNKFARTTIGRHLQEQVVNDILFNVVFGHLNADRVRSIILSSGMMGLIIAVLYMIGTSGFFNYSDLRDKLEASAGTLRNRVQSLQMAGLLLQPRNGGQMYYISAAGRAFLRICQQLDQFALGKVSLPDESKHILQLLEMDPYDIDFNEFRYNDDWLGAKTRRATFEHLVAIVVASRVHWGVEWSKLDFEAHPMELDRSQWLNL